MTEEVLEYSSTMHTVSALISADMPTLSLQDTGDRALHLMSEFRVFHLPVVDRDNYLGLISEDDILDWDTPEEPLAFAEFLTFRPAVFESAHVFEAMKLVKQFGLSVLPVVNQSGHYVGIITTEGLLYAIIDQNAITEPGAILILELEQRNYSLSEIARICEANDIQVLSLFVKTKDQTGMQWITLKVNKTDIRALVATFERFEYTIAATFASDNFKEDLKSNYDLLMKYLDINHSS